MAKQDEVTRKNYFMVFIKYIKSLLTKSKNNPIKPKHYSGSIEPIDYITAHKMNFTEGNIIKYVSRYKEKNGLEDLKKAQYYLNYLIENYK